MGFKYDFHLDAERMIVKMREMSRNICVDGLKNVWHDTSSVVKNLPIFVGCQQTTICRLRSTTTALDFCKACMILAI